MSVMQDQSHGAPINDYFVAGSAEIVQKNSNHSVTGITPSNLSQSRIGLQGAEPLVGDWSGVFKLETFFNPQSGNISDALKSLAQNNGRPGDWRIKPPIWIRALRDRFFSNHMRGSVRRPSVRSRSAVKTRCLRTASPSTILISPRKHSP